MDIIVACGALPFGPNTTSVKSLGGSETAALMASRELAKRGHKVTIFCNLPAPGQPDAVPAGFKDDTGLRWMPIEAIKSFASIHDHDLYIAVRDPGLLDFSAFAKKKVLWAHDIFTKRGMQRALDNMAWQFDEIWSVSEWHRHQINDATGYPLENIVALRNGIVPVELMIPREMIQRKSKQLLYAARPERGLENLVRPGGIMEKLPDYKLLVAMYDHFPPQMKQFYDMIFERIAALPNVEFIGPQSQPALRQLIAESEAYIYPTQFEETSCILAREVIEQQTPIFTTFVGALPETLGESGIFFETWLHQQGIKEPERGSTGWCNLFADFVRQALASPEVVVEPALAAMAERTDLYWDGVAELMEQNAAPREVALTSRVWSLIQDGDVIPARALMQDYISSLPPDVDLTPMEAGLLQELRQQYAFIDGDMQAYYEAMYADKAETERTELRSVTQRGDARFMAMVDEIAKLPPNSFVFEYGVGPGHILIPLAIQFPHLQFQGCDFSKSAVDFVNSEAARLGLSNISTFVNTPEGVAVFKPADAVICSEVLEHVVEPWKLLTEVESLVREGGKVILSTPFGAWEPLTFEKPGRWNERAHLWHLDEPMFCSMFGGDKPNQKFLGFVQTLDTYGHPIGNLVTIYDADHRPCVAVNALEKAKRHTSRHTTAAAVIAYNNEDTILRMLNSLNGRVQFARIALGPATDNTREYIERWFDDHPHIRYQIVDVPKIEVGKFGFDHARNVSASGLDTNFDWFFWIDTDEYLSSDFNRYLRFSSMQGYLLAQHHFTVEPRGRAAEIDRPARLLRTGQGYQARGHIHEHFEVPEGGPGRAWMLPNVDIGHTGYVNEDVRRGRFERNFPFLEWDHEEGSDRKLHHFLWFRDIVHRMRFAQSQNRSADAFALANEAVTYYNEHTEDMGAFGPGIFMALQYLGECNALLGKGVQMKVAIQFDDRQAELVSVWTDYDHFERVLKQFVKTEFEERSHRYY